jgi:hypothetical protein
MRRRSHKSRISRRRKGRKGKNDPVWHLGASIIDAKGKAAGKHEINLQNLGLEMALQDAGAA